MEVQTTGTMRMRGESARAVPVEVFVDDEARLRLISGTELLGEWESRKIGIVSLNKGFAIRAEGEEFVLYTEDDVAVAEGLGLAAASPRMARKVAASHPPQEREPEPEPAPVRSNILAIAFALGGVLVLLGGFVMRSSPTVGAAADGPPSIDGSGQFWIAFVIGGLVMAGVAWVLSMGRTWGRALALVSVLALVVLFILAAQSSSVDANQLLAYGFVAGGLVVGVAVVFSGTVRRRD